MYVHPIILMKESCVQLMNWTVKSTQGLTHVTGPYFIYTKFAALRTTVYLLSCFLQKYINF